MKNYLHFYIITGFLVIMTILFNVSICIGDSLILKQDPESFSGGGKSEGDLRIAHFNMPYVITKGNNTYYRLSYCLGQNSSCGQAAANYFCRKNGYDRAVHFKAENSSGQAVLWVKGNRRCMDGNCTCFAFIDCQ